MEKRKRGGDTLSRGASNLACGQEKLSWVADLRTETWAKEVQVLQGRTFPAEKTSIAKTLQLKDCFS
jgi:hypothetical protein